MEVLHGCRRRGAPCSRTQTEAAESEYQAMILVDTNVLSELMRPKPDKHVLDWMDDLLGSDLGLTAITVAEIL